MDKWKNSNRGVLPKSEFPRLLKETLEEIGIKIASNITAGFKKCGIVPLDPQKVLSLLPNEEDVTEKSWTSAFTDHLQTSRFGAGSSTPRSSQRASRGKRREVEPGKGIVINHNLDQRSE